MFNHKPPFMAKQPFMNNQKTIADYSTPSIQDAGKTNIQDAGQEMRGGGIVGSLMNQSNQHSGLGMAKGVGSGMAFAAAKDLIAGADAETTVKDVGMSAVTNMATKTLGNSLGGTAAVGAATSAVNDIMNGADIGTIAKDAAIGATSATTGAVVGSAVPIPGVGTAAGTLVGWALGSLFN